MLDVSALSPIKPEEWLNVGDITIPIEFTSGSISTTETHIDQAFCFLGDTTARRLCGHGGEFEGRIYEIIMEAAKRMGGGRSRFRVDVEGESYRGQLGRTVDGHDLTLRRLPKTMPRLSDLRLPEALKALLLGRTLLDGGLILIVAPNGQGKTTTASAALVSRLEAFGGYGQTIEDPTELPMHGVWGGGVCIQRPVDFSSDDETPGDAFFRAMIDSMRQFPAIPQGTQLLVGEIQDSRTAVETVKAAIHGHLVIATLHARSAVDAVRRLTQLCSGGRDNMDPETARDQVAATLRGVWYQTLRREVKGEGWSRGQLGGELLWNDAKTAPNIMEGVSKKLSLISQKQTEVLNGMSGQSTLTAAEVTQALGRIQ